MFFLGGMTMGYLHPPRKAEAKAASASIPSEKDRRHLDTPPSHDNDSAIERSVLWAWRTLF
ncbi:hypothetical protein QTL95_01035 [Rhizobium sp. S152]|uniref:hypothetical protein n=1 Tax=Rhizobium sp. S152 TaxID=3055038 RepID=UPI0025AA2103|nr:hypothetical protein [Rhizobium sp. S152]MDM9624459.1 hypothetical protein [Rhizobium sp. S152]